MVLKSDIAKAYADQQMEWRRDMPGLIERDFLSRFMPAGGMVEVVTGIRRCGKSTLMRQIMERSYQSPAYFNFEDSRIFGFEVSDFPKLAEVIGRDADAWFFDEIQHVEGWELFVRQLHDSGKKIYITGSNASLLSQELGSKLTGRHLRHELFPFSYGEYIRYAEMRKRDAHMISGYMQYGGFPVYLEHMNSEVLQTLFRDILLRDIAVRYGIRSPLVLMDLALYLISNIGKEITYNSLRKKFGIGSANTVSDFLTWMEDAYLFAFLHKFSWSAASRMVNPRKVYAVDTGLAFANSLSFSEDRGRLLENIVFTHLRKSGKNLYYFSENRECDFVLFKNRKFEMALQVCEEITGDNLQRECRGLVEAMRKFKSGNGLIITLEQDEVVEVDGEKIRLVPAVDFLTMESGMQRK